jgi:SAM-dependent methyltransferase
MVKSARVRRLFNHFYPASSYFDDDALYDQAIRSALKPGGRLLDAGAGAGEIYAKDYRSSCAEVVGIDLDPRVMENPTLSRAVVGPLDKMELPSGHFDVICCRYVFEHLDRPEDVAREFGRVLKPGGTAIVMTPNRYHYVTAISSVTPLWFHRAYNELRGRKSHDTFPTLYRANSQEALNNIFSSAGFTNCRVTQHEVAPNYLTLAAPLFMVGVAYERLVNRFDALAAFRVLLLGQFQTN